VGVNVTKTLKNAFFAGLFLILPLAITLFIFQFVFDFAVARVNPLVEASGMARYTANIELLAQVITVLAIVAGITLVGLILQLNVGHRTFGEVGKVVNFIPLFRTVYASVRQVANSFSGPSNTYEQTVFVEHPAEGLYSVGFITGDSPTSLEEIADEQVQNVYLPSSPNPTAGRLALVPESRIHDSELSVRQGIRLLMTTGTATTAEEMEEMADGATLDLPPDERSLDAMVSRSPDDADDADDTDDEN
jgi:uncharacterized membrane protein